jgi:N-acetylglucosamine-6-phosphate deacetylase
MPARTLVIVNAVLHTPRGVIPEGSLVIENGRIAALGRRIHLPTRVEHLDAAGRAVTPGLIDLHFYGCMGAAIQDPDTVVEELIRIARALPRWGTTAFLLSPLCWGREELTRLLKTIAAAMEASPPGAQPLGIHLEGPYLHPAQRGAFNEQTLRLPDLEEVRGWWAAAGRWLRLVTMAPELPGAFVVAEWLRERGVRVSMGHTTASFEMAWAALEGPFRLVTHCYNAMAGFHHRAPGALGAAWLHPRVSVMAIADGIHIHPAAFRLLVRLKGIRRMILTTDAIPATGLPEGIYEWGGQVVRVKGGHATLSDGTLYGSVLTMDQAVRNAMAFAGLPFAQAIRMAAENPARALGVRRKGQLRPGADADLVLWDPDGFPIITFVRGEVVYRREQ